MAKAEVTYQFEYLVESLTSILLFYDMQADLTGVISSAPLDKNNLRHSDVEAISEKLGFNVRKVKRNFSQISSLSVPAILILSDGRMANYMPSANGNGRFIVPNVYGESTTLAEISECFMNVCYLFAPKDKDISLDLSHLSSGHSLDWFWNPIISFWDRYAEVLLCTFFINMLAFSIPLFTMNIYDRVVINFVEDTLVVFTIGVITALLFDSFFKMLRAHIIEKVAIKVSCEYDVQLMDRMLNIKDVDLLLTTGEKSNLFREMQGIKDFYASRLVPTVVDIPFFILFMISIYMIAPGLEIIPICAALLVVAVNFLAQSIISRYTAQYFSSMQSKSAYLVEMLGGLSAIKMLGGNGSKLFKWRQVTHNAAKASGYSAMVGAFVSNVSMLITQIAQVFIIFSGAYLIHDGSLTVGGLVACTIIYGRSISPIVGMATVLSRLKQSNDVLKTIDKIFNLPHDDAAANIGRGQKGPFKGKIDIKDLIYQYPGQSHPALYKINLSINAGEHVGLLGKTGAGKSTLSQIVAGLNTPNEGNIYLDNYVYKAIAATELRRSIGYVPQDGFFFTGSIRDNIVMGNDSITNEDLERAIYMSGLDLVIQQTSEGLDMNVGEGGKRLSGGQRQAVSLARAFARDPEILVFDEPTNGMDKALEERISAAIKEFIKNKTFIMVTHRTTLLPLVSRLVLLDKGRIIADGARDEIFKKLSNG